MIFFSFPVPFEDEGENVDNDMVDPDAPDDEEEEGEELFGEGMERYVPKGQCCMLADFFISLPIFNPVLCSSATTGQWNTSITTIPRCSTTRSSAVLMWLVKDE